MLAGISAEYYLRLERGRAQNPSPQILDALARALKLDLKATKYLHQLASPTTSRWDHSVLEVAADGLDRLSISAHSRQSWPAGIKMSWLQIRSPGRCRQVSPRDRTSSAGASWTRCPGALRRLGRRDRRRGKWFTGMAVHDPMILACGH